MDKDKVKLWACLYKDIYINDGAEMYAKRYKDDTEYKIFTPDILMLIFCLSMVYIDIEEKRITRKEGAKRQQEIFNKFDADAEPFYGLDRLSWEQVQAAA